MKAGLKRLFRVTTNPQTRPLHPLAKKRERPQGWRRRVRIMMRHTRLLTIACILLAAGITGIAYFFLTQPQTLRIAVGPPTSEDVKVVQAISTELKSNRASVRLQPIVLAGVAAAAAAIDKGQTDLAVIRRDVGMPKDGQAVAILRKNVVVFIVPPAGEEETPKAKARKGKRTAKATAAKDVPEKIGDLIGRRLGVIGRTQANIELLKVVLKQYNIGADKIVMLTENDLAKPNDPKKISVVQLDTTGVTAAIHDTNPDVIMAVGPISSGITADAIAAVTRGSEQPTFLKIDASEAIAERNPVYESTEIKAGAFGGSPPRPEEAVETIEVSHYIVARRRLPENTVADFTKQLFAIRQVLASEMTSAAKIEKPDTDKDAAVPVHPGASAYLDGELKTFFDRYNDIMFWGVMLLSFARLGVHWSAQLHQGRRPRRQAPGTGAAGRDRGRGADRRNHTGARRALP